MDDQKLPIGYWLKMADQLLTERIDRIQSEFGLTRTGWQILSVIKEKGPLSITDLLELMKPLANQMNVTLVLDKFKTDSIIIQDTDLTLTTNGDDLYRKCLEKQMLFRQKAMNGVSDEEYQITLLTFEKVVGNILKE